MACIGITLNSAFGGDVGLVGEAATGVVIQRSKTFHKRVVVEVERPTEVGIANPEAVSSSRRVVVQTIFDGIAVVDL